MAAATGTSSDLPIAGLSWANCLNADLGESFSSIGGTPKTYGSLTTPSGHHGLSLAEQVDAIEEEVELIKGMYTQLTALSEAAEATKAPCGDDAHEFMLAHVTRLNNIAGAGKVLNQRIVGVARKAVALAKGLSLQQSTGSLRKSGSIISSGASKGDVSAEVARENTDRFLEDSSEFDKASIRLQSEALKVHWLAEGLFKLAKPWRADVQFSTELTKLEVPCPMEKVLPQARAYLDSSKGGALKAFMESQEVNELVPITLLEMAGAQGRLEGTPVDVSSSMGLIPRLMASASSSSSSTSSVVWKTS